MHKIITKHSRGDINARVDNFYSRFIPPYFGTLTATKKRIISTKSLLEWSLTKAKMNEISLDHSY